MDRVIICDLELFCCIGVTESERAQPQRLLATVEAEREVAVAARSGCLADTTDYAAVADRLTGLSQSRTWVLIETLAAEMASVVLDEFGAARVTVEVKKFILPQVRHVAVRVERSRA